MLYGAWWDGALNSGIDRTLYPKAWSPVLAEWDTLTAELSSGIVFSREPASLKVSGDTDNFLWAIDNRMYNWTAKQGCLWGYTDTLAKAGPSATTPAPGELLSVDPVSGRASEIVFRWHPLSDVNRYELWIASDSDFRTIIRQEFVTPADVLTPQLGYCLVGLLPL